MYQDWAEMESCRVQGLNLEKLHNSLAHQKYTSVLHIGLFSGGGRGIVEGSH